MIRRSKPLLDTQCRGGCADGSWAWSKKSSRQAAYGRLLSTVLACLTLETYYRYTPVSE